MNFIPPQDEGRLRAAASGVLPNGKAVVVNADGTVGVVAGATEAVGTPVVFEEGDTSFSIFATFDSNENKIVISYRDNGNSSHGTALVGTVNPANNSISFGTPVIFEAAAIADDTGITFDSNSNRVVIFYRDDGDSNTGKGIVGTVSGTGISFGTAVNCGFGSQIGDFSATFDSNVNKVVFACRDAATGNVVAVAGTVNPSNNSITFGSVATADNGSNFFPYCTFDSNANRFVIAYTHGSGQTGYAIVGAVDSSNSNITFGTHVEFETGTAYYMGACFDSTSNKVVISYVDNGDSKKGKAVVATVDPSDNSITYGSAGTFESSDPIDGYTNPVYDSNTNTVVIGYEVNQHSGDGAGRFVTGTVTGTSISFSSPTEFESGRVGEKLNGAYDSNAKKVVFAYVDDEDSDKGKAVVIQAGFTTLTAENYIGMSSGGQVASGSSATVDIIGTVNAEQSSLTAGQQYFVQTDGTIGLTADDPSVFAGTAISATKLLVKT